MYAGMYTRRLYIQDGTVEKGERVAAATAAVAAAASAIGCASLLEGNKGGATQEIKGAPSGRRAPRLRHVFLDNLFGNINHRERIAGNGRKGPSSESATDYRDLRYSLRAFRVYTRKRERGRIRKR